MTKLDFQEIKICRFYQHANAGELLTNIKLFEFIQFVIQ